MFTQSITPNPVIPAEEGMCLQYVRQAFGLPAHYGSAIEAWNNSTSKHRDHAFPEGVWFPVWWALDKNIYGHVALVAPDGRVYSTSNLNPNPLKVHPNIADVEAYYARYGMTLTYLGWTEDVAGYTVITPSEVNLSGDIITYLKESGVALTLTLEDLQAIQGFVNTSEARIIADNRAQAAFYAAQIGDKIADSEYQIKVFAQAVDNQNTDRAIIDNREQEQATRDAIKATE